MVEGNRSLCLTGEVRERADRFLSTLLDISRNRLQKNISFENVLLNGKVLTKNSFNKFRKGDQLEIEIDPWRSSLSNLSRFLSTSFSKTKTSCS